MTMTTTLNSSGILQANAATHPYSTAPFSYAGGEGVGAGFFAAHPTITDWVLIELRNAATPATIVATRAAFVKNDGTVVDIDGVSPVSFPASVTAGSYYLSVRHRNQLSVVSASTLALSSTPATYNFTTGLGQALDNGNGNAMVQVGSKWCMWAGDYNHDEIIDGLDNTNIYGEFIINYLNGYRLGDINLDGDTDGLDNSLILNNFFIGPVSSLW